MCDTRDECPYKRTRRGVREIVEGVEVVGILSKMWPIFVGFITLVIVLAKMHGDIIVLKEKVKVAFDLINKMNDRK